MAAHARDREETGRRSHLLPPELFRSVLIRERRRADRANRRFGLLLLEDPGDCGSAAPFWGSAADALVAATNGTAVAGWVEGHTRLGVLVPEIRASAFLHDCA